LILRATTSMSIITIIIFTLIDDSSIHLIVLSTPSGDLHVHLFDFYIIIITICYYYYVFYPYV
jgi:hypothetical protein